MNVVIPKRAPQHPKSKKTIDVIRQELIEHGESRVFGLGTFTVVEEPEKQYLHFIKGIYVTKPARLIVEFKMDINCGRFLNENWYGDERDEQEHPNHFVPPRTIGG